MKPQLLGLLLVFVCAAGVALLLVPPVRTLLTRLGMVDRPGGRRINKRPVPRGGGVAVFVAFHVACLAWLRLAGGKCAPGHDAALAGVFGIATALLLAVGLLDDAFDLKPSVKLAGQVVVFTLVYKAGVSMNGILWFDVPGPVDYAFTLGWYVFIVNAFNLIDGLDGLAAGLALIGSLGLAACLASRGKLPDAVPVVALAGACLGFLRYNFSPASIFLGDSGSMFIGFVLATVPLMSGGKSAFLASVGVPLLVMGVPVFDTMLAILRRSARAMLPDASAGSAGRRGVARIMRPDMDHLHHRFLAAGMSQRKAALSLYVLSMTMVAAAVFATLFTSRSTGIVLIGLLVVFAVMARHLSDIELWDTGRALLAVSRHGSKLVRVSRALYLVADMAVLAVAWWASFHLALLFSRGFRFVSVFPIFFCCIELAFVACGVYRRLWGVASSRDHAMLVALVLAGSGVAYAVVVLLGLRYYGFHRQMVVFTLLSAFLLLVVRMGRVLLKRVMAMSESSRLKNARKATRVLAYGAGEHLALVDDISAGSELLKRGRVIIGVIDDDPLLRGRFFRRYRILGGIDVLEENVVKYRIDEILILTDNLTAGRYARALDVAGRHKLAVKRFRCFEENIVARRAEAADGDGAEEKAAGGEVKPPEPGGEGGEK